MSANQHK